MSQNLFENNNLFGSGSVDLTELINPFPGLRPFGVEESHLFFGREGQSDEVLLKLAENKFVSILGASGSGKSSFMYCGLIPSLNGGFMTDAGSNWRVVIARPGGGPIDNLAEALLIKDVRFSNLSEEDKLIHKTIIATVLRSSSLGLVEVVKQLRTDSRQNILVVIDQFEELFRFRKLEEATSDMDESSAFVNLLLEAVHQYDVPIYITITMRSDFIGECAKFPDLTQMINDSHYLIPQMTRDQKRTAIEGPVAVGGGIIAPRLIQQLLNDVGDNPDQLPILQHALMRTWSYWVDNRRESEAMDLRHYNAVGTLREALSQHANEAFDSLSKREKEICEVMFKALTERGSENLGIRRPTKLATIASIAGVSEDEVIRVIDKFREPGRSLLMPPHGIYLQSDTVIDISHESLMRIWDKLKRWLDEESKSAEMYLKLSESAERFQEGKASLWKMPDLQLALNWREENNPTLVWGQRYNPAFERAIVFLETSEKAYLTEQRNIEFLQRRQVRRMRWTALALGMAALICIFLVVLAQFQTQEAKRNEIEANLEKENAKAAQEKAKMAQLDAENAAIIAEGLRKEAENAKAEAEKGQALALKLRKQADDEKASAIAAQKQAAENERLANIEKDKAEAAREDAARALEDANRLRYQSVALSMAIKATKLSNNEAALKGVVAKQGFEFYQEYKDEGKDFNGDIYAGLYSAIKALYLQKFEEKGDSILNQYHGHKDIIDPVKGTMQKVGVRSVVYSQDGRRMYSAGSDGKVLKWQMDGSRQFETIYSEKLLNRVVNLSPNESYLAIGTEDNNIRLVNLEKKDSEAKQVEGHQGAIYDVVFLPGDLGFVSTGADSKIILHENGGEKVLAQLVNRAKSIAVDPSGSYLAAGTEYGEVLIIDLNQENPTTKVIFSSMSYGRHQKFAINALDFSHDGAYLAIADNGGTVVIWDMVNKVRSGPRLTGFGSGVTDVSFGPNDRLLAASGFDKTVRMWDLENVYDLPTVFEDHEDWVWDLDFAPDSKSLVTGCADGIIRFFYTTPDLYADEICSLVNGNLSPTEWNQYVGEGIEYVKTCPELKSRIDE